MAEPITILVGKGQQPDGTAPTSESNSALTKTSEPGKPNYQQQAINTALIQAGKQMMMSGMYVYGNITGDYASVQTMNSVMSIGADVLMVAKGGWIGAIAVGTKYAVNFANSFVEQRQNDFANALAVQRAGGIMEGNIYTNGSRGTNG